jgi:hypothetical protein
LGERGSPFISVTKMSLAQPGNVGASILKL